MKKLVFIIVLFLLLDHCHGQTVIPASTTVLSLAKMKSGTYAIINAPGDTTFLNKDTSLAVIKYLHDTIPRVCPPPAIIPVVGFSINKFGQVVVTYQNGGTSIMNLKNSILIQ